ncbi:MAG: hypothetical protein JWR52_2794 [Marmoricola sp.]|nr:hypothetical protein [Marmoricola sp.]
MSYERLAYDDQDTTVKMHTDCNACASEMGIPDQRIDDAALGTAPSIEYADFPREISKPEITVSDAAAHLASRIHLHLD